MPPRRRAPDVCYEGRITRSRSRGYYSGVDLMGGAQGHHPGDTAFNADRFRNQVLIAQRKYTTYNSVLCLAEAVKEIFTVNFVMCSGAKRSTRVGRSSYEQVRQEV